MRSRVAVAALLVLPALLTAAAAVAVAAAVFGLGLVLGIGKVEQRGLLTLLGLLAACLLGLCVGLCWLCVCEREEKMANTKSKSCWRREHTTAPN